ncbi:HU family DNA-binding protein [Pseudenhygromyxa sp. WMMC2535]|uniref:HU family DNA-binding protein n=1 Tax=Pseudenhygromyxa sp. WMMC2535 TaxID=2712867 RepID=UPI001556045C|nr:HU family DNA-binding protein [Pseudenhygromyxa sp. WMMC2535]NVB41653.1 HU family DNA-binding protein [Pseudenhygromyxa sp. WMMC2535]
MTKAELIDRISRNRDLPPEITKKVIAAVLDIAFAELAAYFVRAKVGRSGAAPRFTFPKFGTFTKKRRNGRRGVNPRTLEPMEIEACETLDFKPSVDLKRLLNEASAPATKPAKAAKPARAESVTPAKKKKTSKKRKTSKARKAEGPGRRKLVSREEAELELPSAPLQRVSGRKRRSAKTGS